MHQGEIEVVSALGVMIIVLGSLGSIGAAIYVAWTIAIYVAWTMWSLLGAVLSIVIIAGGISFFGFMGMRLLARGENEKFSYRVARLQELGDVHGLRELLNYESEYAMSESEDLDKRLAVKRALRALGVDPDEPPATPPPAIEALIQIHASKSPEPQVKAQALSPQQITIQEAVERLLDLHDHSPRGEGFLTHSDAALPVRRIGQHLHEVGGFDLMLEAHQVFAERRPRAGRNLEMVWDQVGFWRG